MSNVGEFVVGFGDLYRIADIWRGDMLNAPEFLLENVNERGWLFQWITKKDLERHFEGVERV